MSQSKSTCVPLLHFLALLLLGATLVFGGWSYYIAVFGPQERRPLVRITATTVRKCLQVVNVDHPQGNELRRELISLMNSFLAKNYSSNEAFAAALMASKEKYFDLYRVPYVFYNAKQQRHQFLIDTNDRILPRFLIINDQLICFETLAWDRDTRYGWHGLTIPKPSWFTAPNFSREDYKTLLAKIRTWQDETFGKDPNAAPIDLDDLEFLDGSKMRFKE